MACRDSAITIGTLSKVESGDTSPTNLKKKETEEIELPVDSLTAQYETESLRNAPANGRVVAQRTDSAQSSFNDFNVNCRNEYFQDSTEARRELETVSDSINVCDKNGQEEHILCYRLALLSERENIFKAAKQYRRALKLKPDFIQAEQKLKLVEELIESKKLKELVKIAYNEQCKDKKYAYKEEIESFKQSESFDRGLETVLNEAVKCKNAETGKVLYDLCMDLKPTYDGDCFMSVRENQEKCAWDKEEIDRLEKVAVLQVRYGGDGEKPVVAPHAAFTYLPFPPSLNKEIAAKYADHSSYLAKSVCEPSRKIFRRSKSKIKIGYVSSDFKDHSLAHLISGIFELHDRDKFMVYLYDLHGPDETEFRQRIKNGADYFRDLSGIDFEGRKKCIEDDEIDVLVNLNGYTRGADNELFSLKLAPVQVMWLGFPGTSGADYMDYFITDPVSTPLEYANDFSEKLAYMPPTHFIGSHQEMFAHLKEKIEIKSSTGENSYNSVIINAKNLQPFKDACHDAGFNVEGDKDCGESVVIPYLYFICGWYVCYLLERNLPQFIWYLLWKYLGKVMLRSCDKVTVFGMELLNGLMIRQNPECSKLASGEVVPEHLIFTARCQYGLPDSKVVYANFCQNYKFDQSAVDMWMQILLKVPNSVLWLLAFNNEVEQNIRNYIKNSNLDIDENRIIFSDSVPKEEYIRRAQLADVFLDTPLCNAHTTAMDAVFAGLPLVTLPGRTIASRIAASILDELGCRELIAKDDKDYVNIAVELGNNPHHLREIKQKVYRSRHRSSLFDVRKKVKYLEQLYKNMDAQRNEKPQHIKVLVCDRLKRVIDTNLLREENLYGTRLGSQENLENSTQAFCTALPSIKEEDETREATDSLNIPLHIDKQILPLKEEDQGTGDVNDNIPHLDEIDQTLSVLGQDHESQDVTDHILPVLRENHEPCEVDDSVNVTDDIEQTLPKKDRPIEKFETKEVISTVTDC